MPKDSTQRVLTVAVGAAVTLSFAGALFAIARRENGSAHAETGVERKITVAGASLDLADRWLDLLPQIMQPFAAVTRNERGAQWRLARPISRTFETSFDRSAAGNVFVWSSPDPQRFSGVVSFLPAPADQGSEVALRITAKLPRRIVGPAITGVLRRFKSLIEAGEIPTLERNPSGRAA